MIRQNIINREEGINLVRKNDGMYPASYLGEKLDKILGEIGVSIDEFNEICDKFINKEIFKCNQAGELIKDDKGNLT